MSIGLWESFLRTSLLFPKVLKCFWKAIFLQYTWVSEEEHQCMSRVAGLSLCVLRNNFAKIMMSSEKFHCVYIIITFGLIFITDCTNPFLWEFLLLLQSGTSNCVVELSSSQFYLPRKKKKTLFIWEIPNILRRREKFGHSTKGS